MKYGFYVSHKATRLTRIINSLRDSATFGYLLNDIAFVFRDCNTRDDLFASCWELGINIHQRDLSSARKDEVSYIVSNELFLAMKDFKVDYLFVFGSRLLKGPILSTYKNKIINFHPSLLPSFPGERSIDQAIEYGSFITGNTAHFIDEGIDTGQIIMQNIFISNDTFDYDMVLDKQIPMLIQIMIWLNEDRITVNDRRVIVKDAEYILDHYIPNLEIKLIGTKNV